MPASERASVCVRVWLPSSATDVGHASLQTFEGAEHGDGHYVSLWPAEAVGITELGSRRIARRNTLSQDLGPRGEGRAPEITVYFYSLDHQAINAAIEASDFQHWTLLRRSADDTSVQNCSGTVIYLLQKGDISKLISRIESNAADISSGLVGGVGGGAVVFFAEVVSGPVGWVAAGITLVAAAGATLWQRNVVAQITASPTDVAKYVLYAKKQEQETLGKKSDDPTRVDLSGHKSIFNFAWINPDDFKAPEVDDSAADEADYSGTAAAGGTASEASPEEEGPQSAYAGAAAVDPNLVTPAAAVESAARAATETAASRDHISKGEDKPQPAYPGAAAVDPNLVPTAVAAEVVDVPTVEAEIDPADWPLHNGMPERYLFSGKHHGLSPALFGLSSVDACRQHPLTKPIIAFYLGALLSEMIKEPTYLFYFILGSIFTLVVPKEKDKRELSAAPAAPPALVASPLSADASGSTTTTTDAVSPRETSAALREKSFLSPEYRAAYMVKLRVLISDAKKEKRTYPRIKAVAIIFTDTKMISLLHAALHEAGFHNPGMPGCPKKILVIEADSSVTAAAFQTECDESYAIMLSETEYNAIVGKGAYEALASDAAKTVIFQV